MLAVPWFIVLGAGLIGAFYDIREWRIPNLLTYPLLLGGLVWHGLTGGFGGVAAALIGALLPALPYIILFFMSKGGAGDAKLMAALGAWLGLPLSIYLLVVVAISGAVLGLGYTLLGNRWLTTSRNLGRMAVWVSWLCSGSGRRHERAGLWPEFNEMHRMPYGLAIFIGSCLTAVGVWLWR